MTLFADRVFADQDKRRSSVWVLIHYDWCPYKNGNLGHSGRHIQKEDDVKTASDS